MDHGRPFGTVIEKGAGAERVIIGLLHEVGENRRLLVHCPAFFR